MKLVLLLSALLLPAFGRAQTTLTGQVTDRRGNALPGANVYIKGTYDGVNTDSTGHFRFQTEQRDTATVAVSFIGYEPHQQKIRLDQPALQLTFRLEEAANLLNTVVITAGTFEASDEKRLTVLKPMDIYTTAGGGADINAVMNLLPGASRVGETEGLFVRGGSAGETKTLIDGMVVQNPFFASGPDIAARNRFPAFLFRGTAFSTGGYSAQYGQALSSVLLLNTTDKTGVNNGMNINANLAGVAVSGYVKDKLIVGAQYTNLRPFIGLTKMNVRWLHPAEAVGGSVIYKGEVGRNGLFKNYTTYGDSYTAMEFRDFTSDYRPVAYKVRNRNFFTTNTYQTSWAEGAWKLQTGASYSYNRDRIGIDTTDVERTDERLQGRVILSRMVSKDVTVMAGGELHGYQYENRYGSRQQTLTDVYSAVFTEAEVYVSRKLAVRLGFRGEGSSLIGRFNVAPRLSMAYKTGAYGQVSLAAGQFFQTPDNKYLLTNRSLGFEQARHLILNYQVIRNERTFRVEGYFKKYLNLVRERAAGRFDPNPYRYPGSSTDNGGHGYAQGIDLFWRDRKSFKNIDYWVSYSYLDTKRVFANYPVKTMPTFASTHTASFVYKHYVSFLKSNLGASWAVASGRPYYNPQSETFLTDRTKPFSSLALSASYITTIKRNFFVIYASLDNVLGTRNIYGYRYSPDGSRKYPIIPPSYRTFFIGVSMNIGRNLAVPEEAK
ncbi:TonB-dependent receptor [Larkinella soli]|uniref:TonB-dependent receptor n=1 Tax=Larkinella soli TaxID=1770527 RepID=UPI000FFBD923|nr:TonB-dependent receptor [Larkinella soli]